MKKKLLIFRGGLARVVCFSLGVGPWLLLMVAVLPTKPEKQPSFAVDVTVVEGILYLVLAVLGWMLPWLLLAFLDEGEP